MSIMDQVKQNLREWYSLAADRTSEMGKISVRMYDKYGISREIERQLSELGCQVYHAAEEGRTDFSGDETFQAAIACIKELERDLSAKVAEIEMIRQQRQQKAAARQAGKEQESPAASEEDVALLDAAPESGQVPNEEGESDPDVKKPD
jgi:beta-galactosidase beta subunit